MNGKLAKKLRREALSIAVESNLPYVDYDFKQYNKVYTTIDGKLKGYKVYTAFMKDCQRKVYQQLKKEFKEGVC